MNNNNNNKIKNYNNNSKANNSNLQIIPSKFKMQKQALLQILQTQVPLLPQVLVVIKNKNSMITMNKMKIIQIVQMRQFINQMRKDT